ncbi:uncharacterized protein K452DRAFT_131008 [Aplosporella prunicola CBS 121167]|uniref:Uncharacterized protein n=1 Tax=Aplosporella prunicola CBS 121167 TaxID=1176127 RepID=A0A6A6AZM8_9PEZI|nr:uncharacterized protein K452DRAFT_131008 [Aplosporella prunicola CBS 121167]KAF2136415.1 hypothetical protein K452DRAFT_131008 [Aplosporella prunicola CBS 121167]
MSRDSRSPLSGSWCFTLFGRPCALSLFLFPFVANGRGRVGAALHWLPTFLYSLRHGPRTCGSEQISRETGFLLLAGSVDIFPRTAWLSCEIETDLCVTASIGRCGLLSQWVSIDACGLLGLCILQMG